MRPETAAVPPKTPRGVRGSTRGAQEQHKRNTRGTQEGASLSPGLPLARTWLAPGFVPACARLSSLQCDTRESRTWRKTPCARARAYPAATPSIPNPPSSILSVCGSAALCRLIPKCLRPSHKAPKRRQPCRDSRSSDPAAETEACGWASWPRPRRAHALAMHLSVLQSPLTAVAIRHKPPSVTKSAQEPMPSLRRASCLLEKTS